MTMPHVLLVLVALQRLIELAVARRNTRRLLSEGGREVGAAHYPFVVLLHAAWLLWLWLSVPFDAPIAWPWLAAYLALQIGRVWTMASLGRYWTTRIIHLPDAPLVRRGPYRFLRHPNYLIVIGELAILPLVFGEWRIAAVVSAANLGLLAWRLRIEERYLKTRRRVR